MILRNLKRFWHEFNWQNQHSVNLRTRGRWLADLLDEMEYPRSYSGEFLRSLEE